MATVVNERDDFAPPQIAIRGARTRGRSRGRPRGRGGSRSSGRGQSAATGKSHPAHGWRLETSGSRDVLLQEHFFDKIVSERARLFCTTAVGKFDVELSVRELAPTRSGHVILLVHDVLMQCMKWTNERNVLMQLGHERVSPSQMYRFLSVILLSHSTGFSYSKTIEVMKALGCSSPSLESVRFISSNILAFSATGRGHDGLSSWIAQRDQTPLLSAFEKEAFSMSRKVFFAPTHLFATLDDDLYGTRAVDNQVKTLSSRKADKEGHVADAIADAFFRITLALRFRRRGEPQSTNVKRLLGVLLEGRGEQSVHGFIVTGDRGYGKMSLLKDLLKLGIGSVFVMPQHFLKCHPFVAQSFFDVSRNDHDDESEQSSGSNSDNASDAAEEDIEEPIDGTGDFVSAGVVDDRSITPYDRPKKFVINDEAKAGPAVLFAKKKIHVTATNGVERSQVTAVAVRERGTEKYCNVLRFLFNVPSSIQNSIDAWIAVPHSTSLLSHLFAKRANSGKLVEPSADATDLKERVERAIWDRCAILTVSQRCADWFVLRQFRITGTNAAQVLSEENIVRALVGVPLRGAEHVIPTPKRLLSALIAGWFSKTRSNEAMKRGTANERAVLNSLASKPFVNSIFELGMLGIKGMDWIACSADGVAVLNTTEMPYEISSSVYESGAMDSSLCLASVEIKTSVSGSSLERNVPQATSDTLFCSIGDSNLSNVIPEVHVFQVIQQLLVLRVNYGIYVSASETGILRVVVVRASPEALSICREVLKVRAESVVAWAHDESQPVPAFADAECKKIIKETIPFWRAINTHVKIQGPFPPLKLFKHGSQTFYSKTKGGVDGGAQARAILISSTSSLPWEQKLVTQTLKTVFINGFIAWRMSEKRELLHCKESFGSLDGYRHSLNSVQSLADFSLDCCRELLAHADHLERQREQNDNLNIEQNDAALGGREFERLRHVAQTRKRNRTQFFNSTDGRSLRLSSRGHEQHQKRPPQFCALCGTFKNNSGYRGHRTTFCCLSCNVHLCIKVWPGFRRSCWALWHSCRSLEPRVLQPSRPVQNRGSSFTEEGLAREDAGGEVLRRSRRRTS